MPKPDTTARERSFNKGYRHGLLTAVKICHGQIEAVRSPKYAVNQPFSSFAERLAIGLCIREIEKTAGVTNDAET